MKYSTLLSLAITVAQYGVGYVWPAYASFQAIESKASVDDLQWLTYWLLFALLTTLESIMWPVLKFIPGWQLAKVGALAWLSLPQTNGASVTYRKSRPYILKALKIANEMAGISTTKSPKGQELVSLRERIQNLQGEVYSTLSTAYDRVAADQLDISTVDKSIEKLEGVLLDNKSVLGKLKSKVSEAGEAHADVKVTAYTAADTTTSKAEALSSEAM